MTIGGGVFGSWEPADKTAPTNERFRPTQLMERVSIYLENTAAPTSPTQVVRDVTGTDKYVRLAIATLVKEGYVDRVPGRNGGDALLSKQAFREADYGETTADPEGHDYGETTASQEPLNHAENETTADYGATTAPTPADNYGGKAHPPTGGGAPDAVVETDAIRRAARFDALYPPGAGTSQDKADISRAQEPAA